MPAQDVERSYLLSFALDWPAALEGLWPHKGTLNKRAKEKSKKLFSGMNSILSPNLACLKILTNLKCTTHYNLPEVH